MSLRALFAKQSPYYGDAFTYEEIASSGFRRYRVSTLLAMTLGTDAHVRFIIHHYNMPPYV